MESLVCSMAETTISYEEVRRLFGDIDDHNAREVIESGASLIELEEVAAHLADETDVMGELERPLTGRALRIYELLRHDRGQVEEER
jgi:hypothetical protein